jgi:LysR family glycine cleavage system transcriptional activator
MKLPPLNALRAFEAVARLGSVSKAADELCVSSGAVSQQLRNLENDLGRELFIRGPNSIRPSDDGESFARVLHEAFADIADAADKLRRSPSRRSLTVSSAPGMAIMWVMPRLGDFHSEHPDVDVVLDQSVGVVSFKNDGIDAAIRFSDGQFDALDSVLLFHPRLYAMASPDYLERHDRIDSLASPLGHRLIDHQYRGKTIRAQHVHWEDVVDDDRIDLEEVLSIVPDEFQVLNAAMQGRGLGLVSRHLVESELASGQLAIACPESVPARFAYYFVWPADARPSSARDAFRDWLLQSFAAYREE